MSGLLIITDSFTAVGDNLYRVRTPYITLLYGMAFFWGRLSENSVAAFFLIIF